MYHAVASAHPLLPPEMHETSCGRAFGLARETARFDTPPTHIKVRGADGLLVVLVAVAPCKEYSEGPLVPRNFDPLVKSTFKLMLSSV